jgi:hypothetical protein
VSSPPNQENTMQAVCVVASLILALFIGSGAAQERRPYAGLQTRAIKALSAEQIADLRHGRGMGLALAAELNGYPGPKHVLELNRQLGLTGAQRAQVEQLFNTMAAEAIVIGEKLIALEAQLEHHFASRSVTPENLRQVTGDIGATQAALRNAHLQYHLLTVAELTPAQVQRYGELRGYAKGAPPSQHRHRH